jgi:hypothetical protein
MYRGPEKFVVKEEEHHLEDVLSSDTRNPYDRFGFGLTAYFNMLSRFMWLFVAMSLIMLPAWVLYGTEKGLVGTYNYSNA